MARTRMRSRTRRGDACGDAADAGADDAESLDVAPAADREREAEQDSTRLESDSYPELAG